MTHQLALWSLAAYFCFTWFLNLLALLFHGGNTTWLWLCHSTILSVLVPLSVHRVFHSLKNQEREKLNWKELLIILLSLIIFSGVIINHFGVPNFWLDEYSQILRAATGDPALYSAEEQQPPGAYILTKVLASFLGLKPIVARWTGLIPMTISLYFFLLFGSRVTKLIPFTFIFLSFYLVDSDILYLALEGRPVGLGVASVSVLLLAITEYLKKPDKDKLFFVTLASYIFLTSVGLQPLTFLGVFTLLNLILYAIWRKKENKDLAVAVIMGGILFFPFQWYILKLAYELKKFQVDIVAKFIHAITSFNLSDLIQYFTPVSLHTPWILFFIAAVEITIYLGRKAKDGFWFFYPLYFFLLFPPLFHFFFATFINWYLNRWYFASFYIVSIALAAAAIAEMKLKRLNWIISIGFSVVILIMTQTQSDYSKKISGRQDWEGLYQKIKREEPQRVYVTGNCNDVIWWCNSIFVGAQMWWEENPEVARGIGSEIMFRGNLQDNGMIYDAIYLSKKSIITVVLVSENTFSQFSPIIESKSDDYNIKTYDSFVIVETKQPVMIKEELPALLQWLIKHSKPDARLFYPYELLIWHYHNIGEYKLAQKWYQKMLELPEIEQKANRHPLGRAMMEQIKELAYPQLALIKKKE